MSRIVPVCVLSLRSSGLTHTFTDFFFLLFVRLFATAASPGGAESSTEVIDLTGEHQVPLKRRRLKIPLEKFDDPALESLTPTIEEWLENHRKESGEVKAKSKYVACPFYSLSLSLPPIFSLRSEKTRRLSRDATK